MCNFQTTNWKGESAGGGGNQENRTEKAEYKTAGIILNVSVNDTFEWIKFLSKSADSQSGLKKTKANNNPATRCLLRVKGTTDDREMDGQLERLRMKERKRSHRKRRELT